MASYLGAFPFPSLAPSILTVDALLKTVVIMTERYNRVLKGGDRDRTKLFFRSMAVFDRRMSSSAEKDFQRHQSDQAKRSASSSGDGDQGRESPVNEKNGSRNNLVTPQAVDASVDPLTAKSRSHAAGFAEDEAVNDDVEDEDDDEFVLAALDSLDAIEVFKHDQRTETRIQYSRIPIDNLRHLIMFLLVTSPLKPDQNLAVCSQRASTDRLENLRRAADSIIWSFSPEEHAGILYGPFTKICAASLPHMFDGLNPLFEHFLFSKGMDLSRRLPDYHKTTGAPSTEINERDDLPLESPLLKKEGDILDIPTLCQTSFFIKGSEIFHRLRLLFSGSEAGFSIGAFEQKVFNWQGPTILLVSGTRLPQEPEGPRQRAFADFLPLKRLGNGSSGNSKSDRVIYGALLKVPWRYTPKQPIGDEETLLFQLDPIHDVFRASKTVKDYATFGRNGINFGNALPAAKAVQSISSHEPLGPVSMFLDSSLEYGVFNHHSAGGGAFQTSQSRNTSWQDRFEIESLEVWGCGGDDEAKRQSDAVLFEAREAEARRGVRLGKDRDADRALLEMAGLIGNHNASGGSMG